MAMGTASTARRDPREAAYATDAGMVVLEVFEDGVAAAFPAARRNRPPLIAQAASVETVRPDGARQHFAMEIKAAIWNRSTRFLSRTHLRRLSRLAAQDYSVVFEEHEHAHGSAARDNNMRAAVDPRHGRRRRVRARDRGPFARPNLRLALDGSACGHRRRRSSSRAGLMA